MTTLRKGYAPTPVGQVHYVEAGAGRPVVLLHQTPRSWDEFRELIPLLADDHRVVAPDTAGFGASELTGEHSIENYASGVEGLLAHLGLTDVVLLGHHTGGVIAVEVAARDPGRLAALVLSSTPVIDAAARDRRRAAAPIDLVERRPDGAHLVELWRRREPYYPAGRPDLLERFVRDALTTRDMEAGHRAVGRYRMEERLGRYRGPTLCIGADRDPFAFPELARMVAALPHARTTVIAGGTVALMEQFADQVAAAVRALLS
jgi:pimeloyl-ACP methyl ester carboxylesterase